LGRLMLSLLYETRSDVI